MDELIRARSNLSRARCHDELGFSRYTSGKDSNYTIVDDDDSYVRYLAPELLN